MESRVSGPRDVPNLSNPVGGNKKETGKRQKGVLRGFSAERKYHSQVVTWDGEQKRRP